MSKTPKNSPTLRRNGVAQAALNRKAPTMRHRNAGKGGQINEQAALLEEYEEEREETNLRLTNHIYEANGQLTKHGSMFKAHVENDFDIALHSAQDRDPGVDLRELEHLAYAVIGARINRAILLRRKP